MAFEEWANIEVMYDSKAKIAQIRPGRPHWIVLTDRETKQLFDMIGWRLEQEPDEEE